MIGGELDSIVARVGQLRESAKYRRAKAAAIERILEKLEAPSAALRKLAISVEAKHSFLSNISSTNMDLADRQSSLLQTHGKAVKEIEKTTGRNAFFLSQRGALITSLKSCAADLRAACRPHIDTSQISAQRTREEELLDLFALSTECYDSELQFHDKIAAALCDLQQKAQELIGHQVKRIQQETELCNDTWTREELYLNGYLLRLTSKAKELAFHSRRGTGVPRQIVIKPKSIAEETSNPKFTPFELHERATLRRECEELRQQIKTLLHNRRNEAVTVMQRLWQGPSSS